MSALGPVDLLAERRERDDRYWTEASIPDLHVGWRRRELDAAVERGEIQRGESDGGLVGYRYRSAA